MTSEVGVAPGTWIGPARALLGDFAGSARNRAIRAGALAVAAAALEGASFTLMVPLLGLVFGAAPAGRIGHALEPLLGATTRQQRLVLLLVLFAGVTLLRAAVGFLSDVAIARLQTGFVALLQGRIVRLLAGARWEYVAALRHAEMTYLMGGDLQRLGNGVGLLLKALAACALLLAQLALAFLLSLPLAVVLVAALVAGLWSLGRALARAHALGGHAAEAGVKMLDSTGQFLGGLKLAVSQSLETGFIAETDAITGTLVARQNADVRDHARARALFTLAAALLGASLLLVGLLWLKLPPAKLITLLLIVARMTGPAAQLQQGIQHFGQVLAIHQAFRALHDDLSAAARPPLPPPAFQPHGVIRLKGVSFRHPGGGGLRDFDLNIAPGTFLAVTGPSGSGKTTLIDLLAGLYPPQTGIIQVGDDRLDEAALEAWRRGLGLVTQEPFLFHDSIARNLAWAAPGASEADMRDALVLAGLASDMPLDRIVGNRGMLVSGGERQRIALARALLRRPHLLLLDEAASAVDGGSERAIFQRLRDLPDRPTIVLVAHRLDNLDLCDRVLHLA